MKSARHWARVRANAKTASGQDWTATLWGSSDLSHDDAVRDAQRHAEHWQQRVMTDPGALERYPYGVGALPEPMIDEILDDRGQRAAAITLNRAGCRVMNTHRVAFVDVDLPEPSTGGLLGRLLRRKAAAGPTQESSLAALADLVASRRGMGARAYRTKAGLRYLVTNPPMDPASDQTQSMLEGLGTDPRYTRLCRAQACFRARLSPKPWRTSVGNPPQPVRADSEPDPAMLAWEERYNSACENLAVCELIECFGTEAPDPQASEITRQHDLLTGVGTALPLA